jgi:RNA polymerase sigma factor (sigma-70 family)
MGEKEDAMEDPIRWEDLYPFMDEVKAMARALLRREHHAEALQTTALVLTAMRRQRLAEQDWSSVTWPNRRYFFGALYRAMERALVDHARARIRRREIPFRPEDPEDLYRSVLQPVHALHREPGPHVRPEDLYLPDLQQAMEREPAQVVALTEALAEMRQVQPQWVEAIEHRFYGGLTLEETARMMGVDERTIRRWWDRARLGLAQRIVELMNA